MKPRIIHSAVISVFTVLIVTTNVTKAQDAYFVDGYHGGVYGHYPRWQTQFMVDQLSQHPNWKINLEIEPETWDSVKVYDPKAYKAFQNAMVKPGFAERIDIVNPSYGQAYLFNISGESIIRQFDLGIRHMRKHFPEMSYTTYSSEEPCFTSALPQILKSFGFKYAVLKNPNTCWGGYTRAHGGELVNWQGPDGSFIKTVPRYESEALEPNSTWQTRAWGNGESYIQAALEQGIPHPVGMCLQDAAWKGGPWLGADKPLYQPSHYVTWTNYFENIAISEAEDVWDFSQEDVLVSLVWGSQVMQQLAQNVRVAENNITLAEKMAAYAKAYSGGTWSAEKFDEGWRNLALAQHHDCWIVPYNRVEGNKTWADKVVDWTGIANEISAEAIDGILGGKATEIEAPLSINVFNGQGTAREELIKVDAEGLKQGNWKVMDIKGQQIPSQLAYIDGRQQLLFRAKAGPLGLSSFRLEQANVPKGNETRALKMPDGKVQVDTDYYEVIINPAKGGVIESLKAKKLRGKELVDKGDDRAFNELRGYFYDLGKFLSSTESPAKVEIVVNGPLMTAVSVKGHIGKHPFEQLISFYQGERKIDFEVTIDWQGSPGIGEYSQMENYKAVDPKKAFYNDAYKLLVHFPLALDQQKVFKNAPFDVTRSELESTFFTRWDSIKNNIILNWVDVMDETENLGVALFSDHTTSYAHGKDHPLALNIQYSGRALWGMNYKIEGPTHVKYALVPHREKWDEAGIWMENARWDEPLKAQLTTTSTGDVAHQSLLELEEEGWQITTAHFAGKDLLVRLFNAEGTAGQSTVLVDGSFKRAEFVTLNGENAEVLEVSGKSPRKIRLSIPRFGVRTLKIKDYHH
ncbi:glycoside hydrolase family 38 C-terminal domain-containing protein [Echinicola rosea]|uniref:Alpha-mannosidase n=1 Tax=Echinicola rosea TaxID=1807691 RepID=A0ABQ1URE8_9BACT|nr:glycoside hydrolase family 38 C-terminal domain-containing protein [Echinicola rosea]GGF24334.1 alpha-mannosidase [Echinicola rosea]